MSIKPALTLVAASLILSACGGSDSSSEDSAGLGNFSVAYVDRSVETSGNPTDGIRYEAGGDLYIKDLSSPNASGRNITSSHTNGEGDVSDPEVSYDATTLLFSMKGPDDGTWNIWEYTIASGELNRLITDDTLADEGDDVDPAYLPDGRIVFSSSRQEKSQKVMARNGIQPFKMLDEYERERTIALHVLNTGTQDVKQISFNPSHDRNPVVLSDGQIMYARWDHFGDRNHFPLFTINPDGTNPFVLYGSFSPGNSLLHPREMPDGSILSSLMPLSGTGEGGALMLVDVKNYSENNEPDPEGDIEEGGQGQSQATLQEIPLGDESSDFGRYTTPYPLWDGTNRALVAWTASQEAEEGSEAEMMGEDGPPRYRIEMFDFDTKTLATVAVAGEGRILTDPIAIIEREKPAIVEDKKLADAEPELVRDEMGILNVKSVYDTDSLNIMSDEILIEGESIPKTDDGMPDLLALKDPTVTTPDQNPARFLRVTKAVPAPRGVSMNFIGESEMEMQQLVGYSTIEPDGSVKIKVPADTPLAISVVDKDGRALQTHTNWLQVRPGETRTCNGCHSPRRGSALNASPVTDNHLNTIAEIGSVNPTTGSESMAETKVRINAEARENGEDLDDVALLTKSITYSDIWSKDNLSESFDLNYDEIVTTKPGADGVINYPTHIQPLWEVNRGGNTCVNCHTADNEVLSLASTIAATGRLSGYDSLMIGKPELDEDGQPVVGENEDGELEVEREEPIIEVGRSNMSSRTSRLLAKLNETQLRSSYDPATSTVDHSGLLNESELLLLAEWIDLGAQYYNSPYEDDAADDGLLSLDEVRGGPKELSESDFEANVHPVLLSECAACHRPSSAASEDVAGNSASFVNNRYVLTGAAEGDFNVTLSMVNDLCTPANSLLLSRATATEASALPHPSNSGEPQLALDSAEYQAIFNWISAGAEANGCSGS